MMVKAKDTEEFGVFIKPPRQIAQEANWALRQISGMKRQFEGMVKNGLLTKDEIQNVILHLDIATETVIRNRDTQIEITKAIRSA